MAAHALHNCCGLPGDRLQLQKASKIYRGRLRPSCAGQTSRDLRARAEEPVSNEKKSSVDLLSNPTPIKRQAESTDWIASTLTRRFGLAGGLLWVGFLAVGSLGEQVKTRLEVAREESAARDVQDAAVTTLPSGVTYQELRIGGGQSPQKGFLVVLDFRGSAGGEVFDDTFARGKPIVFFWGSRPFAGGMNEGLEEVVATMKAGGKRRCTIPASKGFGDQPYSFKATNHAGDKAGVVPANSTLEYEVELRRVSSPPS